MEETMAEKFVMTTKKFNEEEIKQKGFKILTSLTPEQEDDAKFLANFQKQYHLSTRGYSIEHCSDRLFEIISASGYTNIQDDQILPIIAQKDEQAKLNNKKLRTKTPEEILCDYFDFDAADAINTINEKKLQLEIRAEEIANFIKKIITENEPQKTSKDEKTKSTKSPTIK